MVVAGRGGSAARRWEPPAADSREENWWAKRRTGEAVRDGWLAADVMVAAGASCSWAVGGPSATRLLAVAPRSPPAWVLDPP